MHGVKAPSAILFDWDNTLVDSWACIQQAMNVTLTAMGHPPWDLVETKRRVALSLKDSFPVLFGTRWQEARDIFYHSFGAIHIDLLVPLPGALATLQRLAKAGIPMAVVSNKRGLLMRREADHLGWTPYFRGLVGAGDAASDKPSDLPVHLALQSIGVTADDDVWFIGDAAVDMQCAVNAGIRPVLVRHDSWRDEEFADHPPRHLFASWSAFARFLDEILVPSAPV
jgi:phosphoglycolate phosphatase